MKNCLDCGSRVANRRQRCSGCADARVRSYQQSYQRQYYLEKKRPGHLHGLSPAEVQSQKREKLREAALRQHGEGRVNKDGLAVGVSRSTVERSIAWTPERKAAQSSRTTQAYREGRMRAHGCHRGIWTLYDGPKGQINMRSQSEAIFAHKLDRHGVDWQYEPRRFDLGWSTYCPDFYLPQQNLWVEVKGYLTKTAARKIADFQAQGHHLVVMTYHEVRAASLPFTSNTLQST